MSKDNNELSQTEVIAAAVAAALQQVIPALTPDPTATIRAQADAIKLAKEETRETAHSNPTSPEISVFNPRGERDHPRSTLRCKFTINDALEQDPELLDLEEIDLLNALVPGDFVIEKTTGESMRVQVIEHADDWGKAARVNIKFKCNEEDDKIGLPSLKQILRGCLKDKAAKILTMADWRELAALEREQAVA
jgi:hypothetical protein